MKKPRWLILVAAVAGLALVAAACGGDGEGGGGGAAEACAADEFGCAEYGPGEPIKLGTLLAISGDTATLGQDSVNGATLAIDNRDGTLDATGGLVAGREVEQVNEDDGCSAEGGQAGATKLAADPDIVAVIGTSCSSAALGVADRILSDQGIILISPSNTNPNLTSEGTHQPFYLRTAHNDKIQGAVVANFAYDELGVTTAATINDESPYADALAAVFRQVFEAKGGTITTFEQIQSTDTDFKPLLTSIGEGSPEFLYYPDFNPACGLLAAQAADIPGLADTTLAGSDGCFAPDYLEVAGDAANGTFISGPDLTVFQGGDFYKNDFLPAYSDQFGTAPTASFHAHSFDAASILFDAIEAVAIEEGDTLFIPRSALSDALYAVSGYEGITGIITCTPLGDCATDVTIGVFEVPGLPVEGGDENAKPVYSETLTLPEAEALAAGGA
ncbi:MAG: branched-chain amino acid ABC transporter substrate-binding protein [Actinomycetota bacterium]